jgi:polysaccharide biosynthesis/export protein
MQTTPPDDTVSATYQTYAYKVQVNDLLQIFVMSIGENEKAAKPYNIVDPANIQTLASDFFIYLNGYTIDKDGMVEIPSLGKMKVAGLTLEEIKRNVEELTKQYLKNFYVIVKLSGISYSVYGEVQRPSIYTVYRNQLSIFDAIASAGDIKEIGNRRKVQIVRQYPGGIVKTHFLDLTDRKVLESPYYFIQPNDQIYVRPLKIRSLGVGTTGFSSVQAIVTVVTVVILIFTLTN